MDSQRYWALLLQRAAESNVPAETLFALSRWSDTKNIVAAAAKIGITDGTFRRQFAFTVYLGMRLPGGTMGQVWGRLYCDAISIAKLTQNPNQVPFRAMLAKIEDQVDAVTYSLQSLAKMNGCEIADLPEIIGAKKPELRPGVEQMIELLSEYQAVLSSVQQTSESHGLQIAQDMLDFKAQYLDPFFWVRRALKLQVTLPLNFDIVEREVETFFANPTNRSKVLLVGSN
jgi:hypothetical protein